MWIKENNLMCRENIRGPFVRRPQFSVVPVPQMLSQNTMNIAYDVYKSKMQNGNDLKSHATKEELKPKKRVLNEIR